MRGGGAGQGMPAGAEPPMLLSTECLTAPSPDRPRPQADWNMVKRGWDAHVLGKAPHQFKSALEAVKTLRVRAWGAGRGHGRSRWSQPCWLHGAGAGRCAAAACELQPPPPPPACPAPTPGRP
jgi:hypothetical protein